jgi:hypothetical protein
VFLLYIDKAVCGVQPFGTVEEQLCNRRRETGMTENSILQLILLTLNTFQYTEIRDCAI